MEAEKFRQQQKFKQQNLDRIDGEIGHLREELAEIKGALEENAAEMERKQNNITEIEKTIASSRTTGDAAEENMRANMSKKEELTQRQKNFFAVREELAEKKSGLDKETYRLNAQKEKLEGSMEAQINYMWEEYEITYIRAKELRDVWG